MCCLSTVWNTPFQALTALAVATLKSMKHCFAQCLALYSFGVSQHCQSGASTSFSRPEPGVCKRQVLPHSASPRTCPALSTFSEDTYPTYTYTVPFWNLSSALLLGKNDRSEITMSKLIHFIRSSFGSFFVVAWYDTLCKSTSQCTIVGCTKPKLRPDLWLPTRSIS